MDDNRNVLDEFKGMPEADIIARLDSRGVDLEVAIENLQRDFNMGTIVRSANAFGVRTVHVIGSRQWNKRGAMMTDKYLRVVYHASVGEFLQSSQQRDVSQIVAIDNVAGAIDVRAVSKQPKTILVFGAEGPGLSSELLASADVIAMIPQTGSTRSINVGVAAGIAMWEWLR